MIDHNQHQNRARRLTPAEPRLASAPRWICICGALNPYTRDRCCACQRERIQARKA